MKKETFNLIVMLCISTILVFGYKIYTVQKDYEKADNVYSEIREVKEKQTKSNDEDNIDTNTNKDKSEEDIDEKDVNDNKEGIDLSDINSDYKFWINVEGTNVDYPVVQGSNNDFYLNHDFNGNYLSSGSIFLDYRNKSSDYNMVIYGHYMKNKTMFGQLEKFKDEEFFNKHKTITITTKDGAYEYEIFAVGVFDADYGYNKTSFENKEEFEKFLDKIIKKSRLKKRNIVGSNDKIITLSTCSYEFDNARTVVFAVKK